jgi:hypothetical protein
MEHTGWSVVRVLIGTADSMPSWPGPHDRRRVLVEGGPGGRWHAEQEAHAAGLQVLTCAGPSEEASCPALNGEPCPLAAAADAIVVARPRDEDAWQGLLEAHASVHPGVPVCLEPSRRDAADLPVDSCPIANESGVVALVERLAREGAAM